MLGDVAKETSITKLMLSSNKILLREYFSLCAGGVCTDLLTESEKRDVRENNAMYLSGIGQVADFKNGNGRIYSSPILQREVKNYAQSINDGKSAGELDHPDSTVVNLKNASHKIVSVWWEGKNVMVKLKVLSGTPGQQLRSLVNDGVAIGLSSRGLGSVRESGDALIVEDDYSLICWDVVSEASVGSAYMKQVSNNRINEKQNKIDLLLTEILSKGK